MTRRFAVGWTALAMMTLACRSTTEAVPDRLSGAYILATIEGEPIAGVAIRVSSNGQQYQYLIAGDTLTVVGDTAIERHIVFRATRLAPDRDSTWTEEGRACGTFTREGAHLEVHWQSRPCSEPPDWQSARDSVVLRRGGVAGFGYPWRDGLQEQRVVEWWYAPAR